MLIVDSIDYQRSDRQSTIDSTNVNSDDDDDDDDDGEDDGGGGDDDSDGKDDGRGDDKDDSVFELCRFFCSFITTILYKLILETHIV